MVRWRKATGEKFGIGQSMTGLVDAVMLPVADSGWEVGGEDAMRKVRTFVFDEFHTYFYGGTWVATAGARTGCVEEST